MYQIIRYALITVVSLFAISANGAPVAYSVNSDSGSVLQDSLYQIDLATGIEKRVGELTTPIPNDTRRDTEGLAIDPLGTLWGIDDESLTLFPINKASGFVGLSDEVPLTGFPPQPQGIGGNDFGMTFSCDGTLYVVSVQTQTLHRMSLDGSSEIVGATGALGVNISAIAANSIPGLIYGLGNGTFDDGSTDAPNLYSIDVLTGTTTLIGPLGLGTSVSAYDQAGLAFDGQENLWAITDRRIINNEKAENKPSEVLKISVDTGAALRVWTTVEVGFESLAIAPPSACKIQSPGDEPARLTATPIPTLSPLGRILSVLFILLAGMLSLRRHFN